MAATTKELLDGIIDQIPKIEEEVQIYVSKGVYKSIGEVDFYRGCKIIVSK